MRAVTAHYLRRMSQTSKSLSKICATCGRQITWRKKWAKTWSSIIYCSDSCRKHKVKQNSLDAHFESAILSLLNSRKAERRAGNVDGAKNPLTCEDVEAHVLAEREQTFKPATLIPEGLGDSRDEKEDIGDLSTLEEETEAKKDPKRTRERCRQAARRLAARGEVVILQEGKMVDPSFAKGILELSLP